MCKLLKFVGLAVVLGLAMFLAVIAGDYGPWYFAWLVGTTMIVLISVASAVLFDTQEANSNGKF
ncbi:MAG: hypothetical protein PHU07_05280 [Acidocella sp.]|nr:hypothetical protein [Acidocella sp.]